ncbi:hypothetical protein KIN20_031182 [Parelaphostrongylus tenuis]|uniref:Uncharacterized protein n=1 Tax=Parelaphostrongylus tenuis TaxID=148309 RepID=A0AAD5R567_PARTN|nr:hypothetical protein KIN20_031182 [Parelaphostrongylus tenuis]
MIAIYQCRSVTRDVASYDVKRQGCVTINRVVDAACLPPPDLRRHLPSIQFSFTSVNSFIS